MDAVARHVLVKPAVAADPRLQAAEVRDRDDQRAARAHPGADPLELRGRVVEVLEHVPEHHPVLARRGDVGLLDRRRHHLHPDRPRRVARGRRRVEAPGVEARGAHPGDEPPIAGADLQHPRAGWDRGDEPHPVAVGERSQRLDQPVGAAPDGRVRPALIQAAARPGAERGGAGAVRAAGELEPGGAGQLRVGRGRRAPRRELGRGARGAGAQGRAPFVG